MPLFKNLTAAISSRWKRRGIASKEAGGSTSGQITQSNINNFIVKAIGNVNEGAGGELTSSSYDLAEIKDAIAADSYIKLAVMKYSQLIFKAGYNIVSDNDEAAKYIRGRFRMMSLMTGTPTDVIFQQIADDLVAYSNAFLVKSRTDQTNIGGFQAKGVYDSKPVGGYFRVDPASVQIKVDKYGTIKQYQQEAGGNSTKFKPIDVIHIYIDKQAGELFGTPRVIAALEDVKLLRKIEGNVLTLIYRFAIPLYQMKVGLAQDGFRATDQEITNAKNEIEKLASDGILVTGETTEFKTIGAEGKALDATGYLKYFESRVITGLNMTMSMVGRGGTKSDANSMEEMVHDCVKRYQRALQVFIEEKIINELLLEGGFNPFANEEDIVHFQFNEINLETKVKMQTHAVNKFQSNTITFEEMRAELGMDTDGIDENRLYQNMITSPAQIALVQAKLGTSSDSVSASSGARGPDADMTTGAQKTVSSTVQPSNQHGTTTMKVKESASDKPIKSSDHIESYKKTYPSVSKKYLDVSNDVIERGIKARSALALGRDSITNELKRLAYVDAAKGMQKALEDTKKPVTALKSISMVQIDSKIAKHVDGMFKDIAKRLDTSETRLDREKAFNASEYRLRFLCEHILPKAYWFGYTKACGQLGVQKVYVDFGKSDDKEKHNGIIKTTSFSIDDIPAFHAYCTCRITQKEQEPAREEGG